MKGNGHFVTVSQGCTQTSNSSWIYLGFYVAFNTVQVISQRVVGRAEETSTYSSLGFCTVNCRPMASNYQLSHLRPWQGSNPGLRGGRRECYHSATVAPSNSSWRTGACFVEHSIFFYILWHTLKLVNCYKADISIKVLKSLEYLNCIFNYQQRYQTIGKIDLFTFLLTLFFGYNTVLIFLIYL